MLQAGAAVCVLAFSWRMSAVDPRLFVSPALWHALFAFARQLFPPALDAAFPRVAVVAAGRTLCIAVAGTTLSVLLGFPLGVLATPTLWRRGPLLAAERRGLAFALGSLGCEASRGLLRLLRAVPDLLWALVFVVAVGLGPLPGALALGVSYAGVIGRVFADLFEEAPPLALEALHAAGGTRLQIFLLGVLPQTAPGVLAYVLYSFECCVRAAAVLGFIGAGGIGYEINVSMRLFEYPQVTTLLAVFLALILLTDWASRAVRRRFRRAGELRLDRTRGSAGADFPAREWRADNAQPRADSLDPLSPESLTPESLTPGSRTPGSLTPASAGAGRATAHSPQPTAGPPTARQPAARLLLLALSLAVVAVSFQQAGFFAAGNDGSSISTGARLWRFAGRMWPPDFSPEFLRSLREPLLQTLGISVMGTLFGLGLGALLALPSAAVLIFAPAEEAGRRSRAGAALRTAGYAAARFLLALLRAIPELLWVLLCIVAVGLGPFSGTLALGLHTAGVLGKLFAETLEEVPQGPVVALRAAGATPLQLLLWALWPQARATLLSYAFLRWENNLRVSTVVGLVGGGGLGLAMYNSVQLGFYPRVATLVLLVYLLVAGTDAAADRLRARGRGTDAPEPGAPGPISVATLEAGQA